MSIQYDRVYDLTITPVEGNSRVVKGLRLVFEVTKTLFSFPNLAKITIYNPAPDTLATLQKRYTKVVLNAGYKGASRLLFKGEIRNLTVEKTSTDRMVTFYAGDGERDWQNSRFNKTFAGNVSVQTVIKDIMKSFENVTLGALEGLPGEADKLLGQTISGASKDMMDVFAAEYGFTWSIQDGEIVTTPLETPLEGDEIIIVSATTGLLGNPIVTELGADVKTLLNPNLLPNRAFKIESVNATVQLGNLFFRQTSRTTAEGTYKINTVIFKGDSREGEWSSEVKGQFIGNRNAYLR